MSRWMSPSQATAAEPPSPLRLLERPRRRAALTPIDEGDWLERQVERLSHWAAAHAPWGARARARR
jgi:hypothetical protein